MSGLLDDCRRQSREQRAWGRGAEQSGRRAESNGGAGVAEVEVVIVVRGLAGT